MKITYVKYSQYKKIIRTKTWILRNCLEDALESNQ